MDKKILKMAAEVMRELSLSEISIKDGETEIMMKRDVAPVPAKPLPEEPVNFMPEALDLPDEIIIDDDFADNGTVKVAAPLIGIFHLSASDSSTPFVRIGSKVKKGDTVCIIESMKMMNELKAECDGTVTDIRAQSGNLVEYGQTLIIINKNI